MTGIAHVMYDDYTMPLIRTQISLSDDDRSLLDAAAQRTGLSMSALIRQAIHSTYGVTDDRERARAALAATFGVIERERSGEELVRTIRSGRRLAESAGR